MPILSNSHDYDLTVMIAISRVILLVISKEMILPQYSYYLPKVPLNIPIVAKYPQISILNHEWCFFQYSYIYILIVVSLRKSPIFIQGGASPSYKWLIIPFTSSIYQRKHTKTNKNYGLICTNLAIPNWGTTLWFQHFHSNPQLPRPLGCSTRPVNCWRCSGGACSKNLGR